MLFEKFVFKGFGETLKLLNTTQREQGEPQDVQVPGTPTEEEEINDFEELPNYRRLSRNWSSLQERDFYSYLKYPNMQIIW